MSSSGEQRIRFPGHQYPQVIPDVPLVRPGAVAPWSRFDHERTASLTFSRVRDRLGEAERLLTQGPPPLEPVEFAMVADGKAAPVTHRSAVLVALFEEEGETHVVLTRRAFSLRHHRGEVAFPGGRCDEGETVFAAALREAHEEVGLVPDEVELFGWLSPIVTFASSSAIWPLVGRLAARPTFVTDPAEVERAFTVSLADLLDEGAFVEERWSRETPRIGADADGFSPIYFFRVPDDVVWGATGRVLFELLCLVTGAPWPRRRGGVVETPL